MATIIPIDNIWKHLYTYYESSYLMDLGTSKDEVLINLLDSEQVEKSKKNLVCIKVLMERCLMAMFPHSVESCKDKDIPGYPILRSNEEAVQEKIKNPPVFPQTEKDKILNEVRSELMVRRSSTSGTLMFREASINNIDFSGAQLKISQSIPNMPPNMPQNIEMGQFQNPMSHVMHTGPDDYEVRKRPRPDDMEMNQMPEKKPRMEIQGGPVTVRLDMLEKKQMEMQRTLSRLEAQVANLAPQNQTFE
jgi:hypothetical protein